MRILAVDPGSTQSAWLHLREGYPTNFGKIPNEQLLDDFRAHVDDDVVVFEWMTPRGMPTSAEEFETLWWIGRFTEAVERHGVSVVRLARDAVKLHLTGRRAKVGDTNVRAALIDRYGGVGGQRAAVGLKASPGPLYGVVSDVWAALALAVTFHDQQEQV